VRACINFESEEVAGGRSRTSAQARCAGAALLQQLLPLQRPHPHSPASATGTTGAPYEGPFFAPPTACSHKLIGCEGKPASEWRDQ
jgi:hypothetical protein